MGERRNDDGPSGRRRGHPEGASQGHRPAGQGRPGSGPHGVRDTAGLEALLVQALVRDGVDAGAEQRVVAAFREAREAGAHRTGARTRRRDDWRPRERRLGRFSVKAGFSVLIAGLSLGGVAVAGIGAVGSGVDGSGDDGSRGSRTTAPSSTSAPLGAPSADRSSGAGADSRPGSDPAASEPPVRAQDLEDHCRTYERVEGRGKALDSVAWKRLTEAAGGAANVDAYCAAQLRPSTGEAEPGGTGAPADRTGGAGGAAGNNSSGAAGTASDAATAGTGASGNDAATAGTGSGGADNGAENGAGTGASESQGKPARPGGEKNP
ncbi:hypothetical protein WJ438_16155 [Streptomyces sp. GD-15H]|uniref:hypothetical protein n=1 Tax=Streptomyces sp. GD-15H TaxID=3129112 RepID=UPI00324B19F5